MPRRAVYQLAEPLAGPNDEQREAMCAAARLGYSVSSCAASADLSFSTLDKWIQKGRRARAALYEGREIDQGRLVLAAFVEEFERARAVGVKHLEDVATKRAEAGFGTWSEAVTKLERGHRDEWGRFQQPLELRGGITIVVEGRPPRELPDVEGALGGAGEDGPRALPSASEREEVQ